MILLTSGTTGTPKGAKQSGGNAGIGTLKAILTARRGGRRSPS